MGGDTDGGSGDGVTRSDPPAGCGCATTGGSSGPHTPASLMALFLLAVMMVSRRR
jgi:MYXO-CTERM domain-containing protein